MDNLTFFDILFLLWFLTRISTMHRFICLTFVIFILGTVNTSYSSPVQQEELTPEIAKKIPPFPPVGLTAVYTNRGVEISWKRHALESVISYEIYRLTTKKRLVHIATTRKLIFFDKNGKCNSTYTVRAVNSYGTKSPHSPGVTVRATCK